MVCGEACSDMCPHWVSLTQKCIWEGLRRLYLAIRMGRNPWKSQQKTTSRILVEDIPEDGDIEYVCSVESLRGVESKYNEQDRSIPVTQFRLLSL